MIDGAFHDGKWRRWFLPIWLAACAYFVWDRWGAIHWFALGDTDDNLRFAQVRALLAGQGWYDLRQYRIDPPGGISVHWSRLVDLPIAGLILLLRPIVGLGQAARWACALAPLLAFGAGLFGLMLTVRRLVHPWAVPLGAALLLGAGATIPMWMPLRIDHHGWQLATLIFAVAGMADPKPLRGGLTAGLATALSLTIGLELLPYLAVTGALVGLWWVIAREQAPRLFGYGVSLAAATALGYALFGSFDNRAPLCDALTPVYLSTLLLTGGLAAALAAAPIASRPARIAAALAVAIVIAAGFALMWPQCLGRPEHISPELDRVWFSHIREAKPLYEHGWRTTLLTVTLAIVGLGGAAWSAWRARATTLAIPWLLVTILSLFSTLLLLWQTRAGPASQFLGVIGATALGFPLIRGSLRHRSAVVRVLGPVVAFVFVSGLFAGLIVRWMPERKTAFRQKVDLANRRCPTLPALAPIDRLPKATILTFSDLGPRIVATTHHDVIAGPYHRAGDAILDVEHAFRATDPMVARAIMARHGASLLLICPGYSEATVYSSEAPKGFYAQLLRNQVPAWLQPVALPKGSPYRLWRRVA